MTETAEEAEVETDFVVPKEKKDPEDEDIKAASDPGPSTAQTRFSFYDAEEVNEALSPNSDDDPTRFKFYNAKEVNEKSKDIVADRNRRLDIIKSKKDPPARSPPEKKDLSNNVSGMNKGLEANFLKKRTISSSLPTPKSDVANVGERTKPPQSAILPDSKEILRSLQEIEKERDQRRLRRGVQHDATPRHANTVGSYSNQSDSNEGYRDDRSSRREEDATEAKLRKRVENSDILKTNSSGRGVIKKNPYEDAIKEAISLLRQQYQKPSQQDYVGETETTDTTIPVTPGDQIIQARAPDRIMQSRMEEDAGDAEESWEGDGVSTEPSPDVGCLSSFDSLRDDDDISVSDLRNGSSPPPSSEVMEMERRARQERIAKYASKLAELQHQPSPAQLVETATAEESGLLSPPQDPNKRKIQSDTLFRKGSASSNAPDIQYGEPLATGSEAETRDSLEPRLTPNRERQRADSGTNFSIGTSTSKDEEVQRGVERVLLAILERASIAEAGDRPQMGVDLLLHTRSSMETEEVHDRNSLTQALDSLLRPQYSYSMDSSLQDERSSRPSRRGSQERDNVQLSELSGVDVAKTEEAQSLSVVEQLLAEEATVVEADLDTSREESTTSAAAAKEAMRTNAFSQTGTDSRNENAVKNASNGGKQETGMTAGEPSSPDANSATPSSKSDRRTTVSPSDIEDAIEAAPSQSDLDHDDEEESENETQVDSLDGGNDSVSKVLGPLSKKAGGTTGVVLEASNTPPMQRLGREEGVSGEDSMSETLQSPVTPPVSSGGINPASPTILESLSVNAESFMSFMSHALTADSPNDKYDVKDRYAAEEEDDESTDEARELMRTLCAHLLPYGVDTSSERLSLENVPPWDDSNPNEAGYRIIRLTRSQLRRVEREFQQMVNVVMEKSERSLSGTNGSTHFNRSLAANGEPGSKDVGENDDDDEDFERDLEEAEELLDREEKRYNAVKALEDSSKFVELNRSQNDECDSSSGTSSSEDGSFSGSETADDGTMSTTSSQDDPTVDYNPDFPGVRPPGKGEMGDLEFFHLPIIYKSNVTGFEPTKDLYLEPGNVVAGQYLVESELGSAAFSTAYRCIDLNSDSSGESGVTHEEVCLKVIKNTKDFFDQSLDEIKILELLRKTGKCHENHIVEMKTFFYHREHLIIVTELLRQNLFEFGKFIIDHDEEPYFTLRRLCYITRQVLIALRFVHKLGLVHSDVKPENILLGSYSRAKVKLIDFGSSCYLTDRQSSYIQSRSYRAPEVVLGLPYDGKIDIWSLGCVVAEMYTGEVTFQNDSIVSMLSRIEAICGAFPRHMIAQGRQSGRFFARSGLLYEQVEDGNDEEKKDPAGLLNFEDDDDDSDSQPLFDVFQPKSTTLAARLGFDANLMELPKGTAEEHEQALFVDFVRGMLTIDPDSRLSADEALQHPWIVSAAMLTEEDVKYPS